MEHIWLACEIVGSVVVASGLAVFLFYAGAYVLDRIYPRNNDFRLPVGPNPETKDSFVWKDACRHLLSCRDPACVRCKALSSFSDELRILKIQKPL